MKTEKYLIVLGLDSEKKPHAARFDLVDEAAVRKAASHKQFKIGHAKTREAAELANKLIDGQIFDSGRGLVPFVSVAVYDKLLKLLEIEAETPGPVVTDKPAEKPVAAATSGTEPFKPSPYNAWDGIEVNATVLWRVDPKEGWFECNVVAISKDRKFLTLRWRDYKGLPTFEAKRIAVGLLCKIK